MWWIVLVNIWKCLAKSYDLIRSFEKLFNIQNMQYPETNIVFQLQHSKNNAVQKYFTLWGTTETKAHEGILKVNSYKLQMHFTTLSSIFKNKYGTTKQRLSILDHYKHNNSAYKRKQETDKVTCFWKMHISV